LGAPIEFLLVGAMAPPLLAIVDTSELETLSPNDSPSTLNSTDGYDTITVSFVQIMGFLLLYDFTASLDVVCTKFTHPRNKVEYYPEFPKPQTSHHESMHAPSSL